jgi:hypothetical protein
MIETVYDAFVSSSKSAVGWVDTFLLPGLEAVGLKVCIPARDFSLGLPEILNVETAIQRSRKVLLVLTPDWIAGEWSAFEALLAQTADPAGLRRRTLPLLLEDCSLPPRIRALTHADFRDSSQWPHQLQRVIKSISESEVTGILPEHLAETIRLFLATNFERDQYARLDQAGESDDHTTLLRRVFVDLHVKVRSGPQTQAWFRSDPVPEAYQAQGTGKPESTMRWLLRETKFKAVIIGGPGQGKSTLGQYLAQAHRAALLGRQQEMAWNSPGLESARKQDHLPPLPRIPFRIILKYFAQWLNDHAYAGTVENYISHQVHNDVTRSVSVEEVHAILRLRPVLLIFDGLDEVIEAGLRARLLLQIQEFLQRAEQLGSNIQTIATSRPTGYTNQFSPEHFWHLELQPMTAEKVRDYAIRWMLAKVEFEEERRRILETLGECQAEEHTKLLLTTPLQVSIVLVIIKDGGRPPAQREALFHEYWSTIFRRERAKGKGVIRTEESLLFDLHAFLAYLLHRKALGENVKSLLTKDEFETLVGAFLQKNDRRARPNTIRQRAAEIVKEATDRLVLLVEPEPGLFGFELRSIQEFFAAAYLSQSARDTSIRFGRLRAIALSEHWKNVALFFAGRVTRNFGGEAANILELVCRPIDREMPDLLLKRGAWLALDIAADGAFSNRDLQYGAIDHGLSVLEAVLPRSKKHRLLSALARLSSEDRRDIVKPILRRRIRGSGSSNDLLPDFLEFLGGISGTRKDLLEGLEVLVKGNERDQVEAFRLAVRFKVEPEWLASKLVKNWDSFLGPQVVSWFMGAGRFKYLIDVIALASLTESQSIQLTNAISRVNRRGHKTELPQLPSGTDSLATQVGTFCSCLQLVWDLERGRDSAIHLHGLVLQPSVVESDLSTGVSKFYSRTDVLEMLRRRDLLPSLRMVLWSVYFVLERPRGSTVDRFFTDVDAALRAGVDRDLLRGMRFDFRWPLLGAAVTACSDHDRVLMNHLVQALREDRATTISRTVQTYLVTLARMMDPNQWVDFLIALRGGNVQQNENLAALASKLGVSQDKLVKMHVKYFSAMELSADQTLNVIRIAENILRAGDNAFTLVSLLEGNALDEHIYARRALKAALTRLCRLSRETIRDISSLAELLIVLGNADEDSVTDALVRAVAKVVGLQEGVVLRVSARTRTLSVARACGRALGARDLYVRRGVVRLWNALQSGVTIDSIQLFSVAVFKWLDLERCFNSELIPRVVLVRLLKACVVPIDEPNIRGRLQGMMKSATHAEVPAWQEFLLLSPIWESLRDYWYGFLEEIFEERQAYNTSIIASAIDRYGQLVGQATAGNLIGEADLELPE